jgi:hypothetical protein
MRPGKVLQRSRSSFDTPMVFHGCLIHGKIFAKSKKCREKDLCSVVPFGEDHV